VPGMEESATAPMPDTPAAEGCTDVEEVRVSGREMVLVEVEMVLVTVGNGRPISSLLDLVFEEKEGVGELALRGGNVAVVERGMVERVLVEMISEVDSDEESSTVSVHVLTSSMASFPPTFIEVKTRTQVTTTVPIGETAVLTVVRVWGGLPA